MTLLYDGRKEIYVFDDLLLLHRTSEIIICEADEEITDVAGRNVNE